MKLDFQAHCFTFSKDTGWMTISGSFNFVRYFCPCIPPDLLSTLSMASTSIMSQSLQRLYQSLWNYPQRDWSSNHHQACLLRQVSVSLLFARNIPTSLKSMLYFCRLGITEKKVNYRVYNHPNFVCFSARISRRNLILFFFNISILGHKMQYKNNKIIVQCTQSH